MADYLWVAAYEIYGTLRSYRDASFSAPDVTDFDLIIDAGLWALFLLFLASAAKFNRTYKPPATEAAPLLAHLTKRMIIIEMVILVEMGVIIWWAYSIVNKITSPHYNAAQWPKIHREIRSLIFLFACADGWRRFDKPKSRSPIKGHSLSART